MMQWQPTKLNHIDPELIRLKFKLLALVAQQGRPVHIDVSDINKKFEAQDIKFKVKTNGK